MDNGPLLCTYMLVHCNYIVITSLQLINVCSHTVNFTSYPEPNDYHKTQTIPQIY